MKWLVDFEIKRRPERRGRLEGSIRGVDAVLHGAAFPDEAEGFGAKVPRP
jgi:hypothetical protein